MQLITVLKEYGLTHNQAKIYLHLLETVEASAYTIAQETGIPKTTCYALLEELKTHGLVLQFRKGNTKMFTTESPSVLLSRIERKHETIKQYLPMLEALVDTASHKPRIKCYEGRAGAQAIFEDVLKMKAKETFYITEGPDIVDFMGKGFYDYFRRERIKRGLFAYGVWMHPKPPYIEGDAKQRAQKAKEQLREVRQAPDHMPFVMTMQIYDSKVALLSSQKESYGFIVESKEFVQLMKHFWDMLWNVSAPL